MRTPTCHKSKDYPTAIDLVITNVPKKIKNVECVGTSLSDFHDMICFSTKTHQKRLCPKYIMYRSYKHFNDSEYLRDLDFAPFHVGEVFDDVDDSYWFASKLLETVIDVHAPMKKRIIKHRQVPYMNSKVLWAHGLHLLFSPVCSLYCALVRA